MDDYGVIGDGVCAGLVGGLEDLDVGGVFPGRHRLVIVDAAIDRADKHGRGTDIGPIEMEATLSVRLRAGHGLHAALEVDEDHVDSGGRFAGCAVVDGAGESAGKN